MQAGKMTNTALIFTKHLALQLFVNKFYIELKSATRMEIK
jgi:hypothetical protein